MFDLRERHHNSGLSLNIMYTILYADLLGFIGSPVPKDPFGVNVVFTECATCILTILYIVLCCCTLKLMYTDI